jgi:hypothetical protein
MGRRPYISAELDRRVRAAAQYRCGYCLSPQHLVMARLEIEHMIPLSRQGSSEEWNLWLACPICNRHKGDRVEAIDPETGELVALFNPRMQVWSAHFCWIESGLKIRGLTPTGRATVAALRLSDDPEALVVRSFWIQAGWHPPVN